MYEEDEIDENIEDENTDIEDETAALDFLSWLSLSGGIVILAWAGYMLVKGLLLW